MQSKAIASRKIDDAALFYAQHVPKIRFRTSRIESRTMSLHRQLAHQAPASALPPPLPAALDSLVDRLNASSGHSSSAAAPPPIRAILVGTNEGSPLHRSFGTAATIGSGGGHGLSEEILASVESIWSTLPSNAPPHVMAAAQAADAAASAAAGLVGTISSDPRTGEIVNDAQPPHPLLTPLGLGDEVRVVTVFYDSVTLMHVQLSPLVVTILATPSANIGSVRSIALPLLKELLQPVRKAILLARRRALSGGGDGLSVSSGGAAIGPGGAALSNTAAMEEAFAAGFRAGSFPRNGAGVSPEYYQR